MTRYRVRGKEMESEPKPWLVMSPGRTWSYRVIVLLAWLFFVCNMLSQLLSDVFTPQQRGARVVGTALITVGFLYIAWATPRGVRLDPPDEFAPERYPPGQRGRARMNWGQCILLWGVACGLGVLAGCSVLGVAGEWRRAT